MEEFKHQATFGPEVVNRVILQHCAAKGSEGPQSFGPQLENMEKHFANKKSVEEIISSLNSVIHPWNKNALQALKHASPTSLKVTFRLIREIVDKSLPLDSAYNLGFRAAMNMIVRNYAPSSI